MDMYRGLHNISGRAEATTTFRDVLQVIATNGLCRPDDDLYDDSTPRRPKSRLQGCPSKWRRMALAAQGASA